MDLNSSDEEDEVDVAPLIARAAATEADDEDPSAAATGTSCAAAGAAEDASSASNGPANAARRQQTGDRDEEMVMNHEEEADADSSSATGLQTEAEGMRLHMAAHSSKGAVGQSRSGYVGVHPCDGGGFVVKARDVTSCEREIGRFETALEGAVAYAKFKLLVKEQRQQLRQVCNGRQDGTNEPSSVRTQSRAPDATQQAPRYVRKRHADPEDEDRKRARANEDSRSNGWLAKKSAAPRQQETAQGPRLQAPPFFPRPSGRGPQGMEWDTSAGTWVPLGTSQAPPWVPRRDREPREKQQEAASAREEMEAGDDEDDEDGEEDDDGPLVTEAEGLQLHLSSCSSGYKGVYLKRTTGLRYVALHLGKHLGYFGTKAEAAVAYARHLQEIDEKQKEPEEEDDDSIEEEDDGHALEQKDEHEGAGASAGDSTKAAPLDGMAAVRAFLAEARLEAYADALEDLG